MSQRKFPSSSGNMIKMNFNVGPSYVGPEVQNDIRTAIDEGVLSISHRSPRFSEYFAKAKAEMFKYFSLPEDWHMYCLGTASEVMESACRGLVRKRSMHFVNGNFSRRAYEFALMAKKDAQIYEAAELEGFAGEPPKAPDGTECAFFTKTETATGVSVSWDYIRAFKAKNPGVMIVCDVVSVVPTEPLDHELCDVYFFSVQKGTGLTAGLGIALVSPAALARCQQLADEDFDVGANRAFITMNKFEVKNATLDTPQVLHIYLLGKAFERFNAKGVAQVKAETAEKAKQIYDWLDSSESFHAAVKDPALRAHSAIAVGFNEGIDEATVLDALNSAGYETGLGYGHLRGTMIRIANFPVHTMADHRELIECLESVRVGKPVS